MQWIHWMLFLILRLALYAHQIFLHILLVKVLVAVVLTLYCNIKRDLHQDVYTILIGFN